MTILNVVGKAIGMFFLVTAGVFAGNLLSFGFKESKDSEKAFELQKQQLQREVCTDPDLKKNLPPGTSLDCSRF